MQLIFVHGWSVTNTYTYGNLPRALSHAAAGVGLSLDIQHIYLGRYISFNDNVTMDDIARAMDRALRDLPGNSDAHIAPFSCITHSTGGPVVRSWVDRFYGARQLDALPLKHLVMLAPANHGSTLAVLGKARVGRIKAWFSGIEPGQRVLDWLGLGSEGQWELNHTWLDYDMTAASFYPFVLTGQGIDHKFYDFINSYLVEKGSDGVIRVAGANLNYSWVSLVQSLDDEIRKQPRTLRLKLARDGGIKHPQPVALRVYNQYSHTGKTMGIMQSIGPNDTGAPVVQDILKCVQVDSRQAYENQLEHLQNDTRKAQKDGDQYCMLVFNVHDDQGEHIAQGDYDLLFLAGSQYQPGKLPKGFFMDRQMNQSTGRLVYYLNVDKMQDIIKTGQFGLRVVARPVTGFAYYAAAEFRPSKDEVQKILMPNQTIYVDIMLHRFVDKNVFRFGPVTDTPINFKNIKPSGETLV
ncbi:hypothetical protein [uncultured Desulfobacter sp.]|uniref:esterase/lipase family protein n=1 Tax=uncultured Desulfobacter sp. TaxID=240139 RepID=UPI002AAC313D|nr:hypothetical protein [uncultured Desulfobacter sp.]